MVSVNHELSNVRQLLLYTEILGSYIYTYNCLIPGIIYVIIRSGPRDCGLFSIPEGHGINRPRTIRLDDNKHLACFLAHYRFLRSPLTAFQSIHAHNMTAFFGDFGAMTSLDYVFSVAGGEQQ